MSGKAKLSKVLYLVTSIAHGSWALANFLGQNLQPPGHSPSFLFLQKKKLQKKEKNDVHVDHVWKKKPKKNTLYVTVYAAAKNPKKN